MSILARDSKQLTYIYTSSSELGKQALGYLKSSKLKLHVIDLSKETIGDSVWAELADNLNSSFGDMFSLKHLDVKNKHKDGDFDENDWLKIVGKNPSVLQKPILVNGNKVKQISRETEALEFFGVDSAGLKKTFGHENPTISPTSENETFV
jgi:arsenate reductase